MNQVLLVGRMVFDPELKTTKSGTNYLPLKIAIDRRDKDKNTDFLSCRAWSKTADFIAKYFHKGDPIEIVGRLQSESYEKQDGTKVNEMVVIVNEVNFVPRQTEKKAGPGNSEPSADAGLPFEV